LLVELFNFRDCSVATLGCFAKNLGIFYAFHVEIVGVMMTIENLKLLIRRVKIFFGLKLIS
jgi:hypothetical protein